MRSARSITALWAIALGLGLGLAFAGFVALGTWQLERRVWKLALIEHVEQRVHAASTPAPGPQQWPRIQADTHEYRHVYMAGTCLYALSTWVQASTELGPGYWVMTPIRSAAGWHVLVNLGYVATADRGALESAWAARSPQACRVVGLLRMSETRAPLFRHNDALHWYTRDVAAITTLRGLGPAAPYFIDVDASAAPQAGPLGPVGGLTVLQFHNNHLVYALTWYALALMVAWAAWLLVREERQLRMR